MYASWFILRYFGDNSCFFALFTLISHSSLAPPSPEDVSCGRQDILKGVYYAWFWRSEILEKFQNASQKQGSSECPLVVSYVQPSLCQGHWCTRTPMATLGTSGLLVYRIWRGASLVARFDKQGHSYEPQNVERATVQGFTLSFCLHVSNRKTHGCRSPRP